MGKILAGIIGGAIVAILGGMFITWSISPSAGSGATIAIWVVCFLCCMVAKSGGKAWRYMLIVAALLCFLMPLSGIIFTGHRLVDSHDGSNAHAAGTIIGGGIVAGFLGFAGFFLGLVFLIIGLLTGRDKQVVIVQQTPPGQLNSYYESGPQ